MKIKFISPKSIERNIKASVHKSGKMGFTIEAADKLLLSIQKSMSIGINEDDKTDRNLYVIINKNRQDDAFPILKAGAYYYVNTKDFFKSLNWDYDKNSISFDIVEENIDDMQVFMFKLAEKERAKK